MQDDHSPEAIELVCPHRPLPSNQDQPDATVFVTARCLAALSPSAYVRLSNQGVRSITLRLDACADCP
ncbi:MAG: hypothetical protein AAF125_24100, partial [Chloroflexota bacterium]